MVLGDAVSTLDTFVRIWNHVSRTITWSLFTLRISILSIIAVNVISLVAVSDYLFVKL